MNVRADHMSYRNGSRVRASSVLLRQPQQPAKVRVALVGLVWGEEFADFFARYCIPSLLEPHSLPSVAREQEVTLLLYTDRATREFLERCDSFTTLCTFVQVEWLLLEHLPAAARSNHWVPWQHAVAGRSDDFDVFLVIIPDCVYASGSLGRIIAALEQHDTVCYSLPQVCRETVSSDLDGRRVVDDHEYIGFTACQAVELFIRHVNPKHAAAACSGTFFINHPEYAIELSPNSMVLSETASHPLAVRSSTRSLSYTFDAVSPGARTCYLEILGVSAEPALKFLEQYFRWPKLHRDHSRVMNLGSWAWNFRDAGNTAYCQSAVHIALDRGLVLEQHRGEVRRAKTRFINATLDYLAVAVRVYGRARQCPDAAAVRYVALAIATPGLHRHLRRLQSGCTVVLPTPGSRFEAVVERIERHPAAQAMLRRFLLLHVVAGRLSILPGLALFLARSDADQFAKACVVDAHSMPAGPGLCGKAITSLQWVWDSTFCIEAEIDYSHLTWSMLDPVHGTSGRVLDDPGASVVAAGVASAPSKISKVGLVKGRRLAILPRLPVLGQSARRVRDLYRKVRGRLRLRVGVAGLIDRILRLGKRRAPRLYAVAREVYRRVRPRRLASESGRSTYEAISQLNIVDNVAKVTVAFHERLGLDPQQSPVCSCLAGMRTELAAEVEAFAAISPGSSLERFEFAWRAYEAGRTEEALQQFGAVIADGRLARAGASDPRSREAFIRSAEILGRHAELCGDSGAAADLYRRILEFDGNGIIARRLLLMLWRQGRMREAAGYAPRVMQSDSNLVQHVRGSDAVGDLTRRLQREAHGEPTTARGQNARDFGLQVG
jgi:hypothetical protein